MTLFDKRDEEKDMYALADEFFTWVRWQTGCEFGGIGLKDKRPFGNSYVEGDILRLIGLDYEDLNESELEAAEEYARHLYGSLPDFLRSVWDEVRNAQGD